MLRGENRIGDTFLSESNLLIRSSVFATPLTCGVNVSVKYGDSHHITPLHEKWDELIKRDDARASAKAHAYKYI